VLRDAAQRVESPIGGTSALRHKYAFGLLDHWHAGQPGFESRIWRIPQAVAAAGLPQLSGQPCLGTCLLMLL